MHRRSNIRWIQPVLALAALVLIAGCAAAAGAAAGAAGAIAYTERGVTSEVDASVPEVVRATEATFRDLGIRVTRRETEEDGTEVEIEGESGDMDIQVDIERDDPPTTEVSVYARKNVVDYDRDYARSILQRIITRLS